MTLQKIIWLLKGVFQVDLFVLKKIDLKINCINIIINR